jgi:lipoprotein-releasing system permease protein
MLFLALRYLLAKKRQTILIILGIFLGAASFITISGLMLGFREYIINELVHNDAHVFIQTREDFIEEHSLDKNFYPKNEYQHVFWTSPPSGRIASSKIENPSKWHKLLKANNNISAFSPRCNANATFSCGSTEAAGYIIGCHPNMELNIKNIRANIQEGRFEDIALGNNRLAISDYLAKHLGIKLNQTVLVSVGKNPSLPFKIVAIFKNENHHMAMLTYGLLESIQMLKQTPNQINEIVVKLHDHTLANFVANTLANVGKEKIESWITRYAPFFRIFTFQDFVRFVSVGMIMLVAGFGIYNVLNMTVMQKRKDIAILRSIGYSSSDILFLFFFQGILLGIIGTALGILVGYFLCLYLETITFFSNTNHLLISFSPKIYLQASLLGLLSSCTASLLPAFSAKRLSPIEIIRAGAE